MSPFIGCSPFTFSGIPLGWCGLVLGTQVCCLAMLCWRVTTPLLRRDLFLASSTCPPSSILGFYLFYCRCVSCPWLCPFFKRVLVPSSQCLVSGTSKRYPSRYPHSLGGHAVLAAHYRFVYCLHCSVLTSYRGLQGVGGVCGVCSCKSTAEFCAVQ